MSSILDNSFGDPAVILARSWYQGMNLVLDGVDFGKCSEYDVLQIVNRSILNKRKEDESRKEAGATVGGESHNATSMETPV